MDIHIHAQKKLSDIQNEFTNLFPFLKLSFYNQTHEAGEGTNNEELIKLHLTIREAGKNVKEFDWNINGEMTVIEFENTFQQHTGLGVQVFRKSGLLWLQTITTDYKTLSAQNARGAELAIDPEKEEPLDYKEMD